MIIFSSKEFTTNPSHGNLVDALRKALQMQKNEYIMNTQDLRGETDKQTNNVI